MAFLVPILIILLTLGILLAIVNFVLNNLEMFQQAFVIHFNLPYLGNYASQPIQFAYLIAACILIGALATAIPGWLVNIRLIRVIKKQKKELENLQKELDSLKPPPTEPGITSFPETGETEN
ncbi:MAG TPA: LapA family protein [Candidatus Limnocylindrales bacterium]|nr:LapA family protein [Candidatus Limnocylindrales bacterium]